ncbi:hypothetical protein [Bacillus tuaregi]|uniref:hypothetical protein n=1 Tax=Bacillus tuaregi TaxID=1816695 RepID=UPI0008F9480A|nr:hypothetical protein [Bacillus tuaregi]
MKQTAIFRKVAIDMFFAQLMWAGGFLGVMLIVNIVKIILTGMGIQDEVEGYFNSIYIAANIFMLIVGILSIYFLPHFVGNGVTRRDCFLGTALASIGLSITIPIITLIISLLEKMILGLVDLPYKMQTINDIELDGNLIGDIVQSIILTPYVNPLDHWLLAICVLSLNLFIYYLLGWFISSSFYRFDFIAGLAAILTSIVIKMLLDTLLRIALELPVFGWFSKLTFLPMSVALCGILVVILLTFWSVRRITKRVSIKM